MFGQVEAALGNCDLLERLLPSGALELVKLGLDRRLMAAVVIVGELQEDKP